VYVCIDVLSMDMLIRIKKNIIVFTIRCVMYYVFAVLGVCFCVLS